MRVETTLPASPRPKDQSFFTAARSQRQMGTCGAGRGGSPLKHLGARGPGPLRTGSSRAALYGTGRALDPAAKNCVLGAQRSLWGAPLSCSARAFKGGQRGGSCTGGRARRVGRGARLREGGLGRGAGGFRGNVPEAWRETKRARFLRARVSRVENPEGGDGCAGHSTMSHTSFSFPTHLPTSDCQPRSWML